MAKHTKKEYQACITMLLEIHESDEALEEMKEATCETNSCKCQGQIADVIRYLMRLRDEEAAK